MSDSHLAHQGGMEYAIDRVPEAVFFHIYNAKKWGPRILLPREYSAK